MNIQTSSHTRPLDENSRKYSASRLSRSSRLSEKTSSTANSITPSKPVLKRAGFDPIQDQSHPADHARSGIFSIIAEKWKNKPIFRYGDATQDAEELTKAALINLKPIFNMYKTTTGKVRWITLEQIFAGQGLNQRQDPMIQKMLQHLHNKHPHSFLKDIELDFNEFKDLLMVNLERAVAALMEMLAIHDFERYISAIKKLFEKARQCNEGQVWDEYGEPWTTDSEAWGFSVVSIHGQRSSLGCSTTPFPLTNLCEPLILSVAYDLLGHAKVDTVIDRSEIGFDDNLRVNSKKQSKYPFGKLATVMVASLIRSAHMPNMSASQKHDYFLSFLKAITGGEYLRFNNGWYTLEKENDHLFYAASELIQSIKGTSCNHPAAMDFLMQIRAMEVNCESLATIAATLANGGVSLVNGNVIISPETVLSVLELMERAGHGKQSPSFTFQIGLPCKSGQSGGLMVVIPGVLGMGLYSPRVHGLVSPRAFQFLKSVVDKFEYHPLWHTEVSEKRPRILKKTPRLNKEPKYYRILTLAAQGDLTLLQEELAEISFIDEIMDPLGLTVLHISAVQGHLDVVKFLVSKAPELMFRKDAMDMKPVNYAEKSGSKDVMGYLKDQEASFQMQLLHKKISEKKRVTISNEPPTCINFPCDDEEEDENFINIYK